MSDEWDRGVLDSSSWHRKEQVGIMTCSEDMITHGELCGAWPIGLALIKLFAEDGLEAPDKGVRATYLQHPDRILCSSVGNKYRATACQEWRDLIHAACLAGAKPTGAFSLRDGSRVVATFEIGMCTETGLNTQLLLCDSFDGSLALTCGFTTIRVVCANTLACAISQDGHGFARLKHTAALETKVKMLQENIGIAIKSGQKVNELYEKARTTYFANLASAEKAFNLLFPEAQIEEGDSPRAIKHKTTRANNERNDGMRAAQNPINKVGAIRNGNLATLWNAATYLVDREADGSFRKTRSEDRLDSMLFGPRGKEIETILTKIEVIMRDGSIQTMTQTEALEAGVSQREVGKAVIKDLLDGLDLSS